VAPEGTRRLSADPANLAVAAAILRAGGLVAFPTETLYGLGADARNDAAVRRVFAAKARPSAKALIVLVQNLEEAAKYGIFDETALRLADAVWPGALTLVVRRREDCAISGEINPGGGTIALRAPGSKVAHDLLRAFDGPLTAPSANPSGVEPPTTADEVLKALGGSIDAVLDGGPCPGGESTILDFSADRPRLLREGAIPRAELSRLLYPATLA
jgi:L-threonylcarbamoyladenylate synthase